LFTTPVIYLYLDRLTGARRHAKASGQARPDLPQASGLTPGAA
jgi:hypothetical protein